jgi:predicted DNA binding CopG/RHH family protein
MNFRNEVDCMRDEYDFTEAKKNPYIKKIKIKKQITIKLDNDTVEYFKEQAENSGIPYQTLINLYLSDCAENKRELHLSWK